MKKPTMGETEWQMRARRYTALICSQAKSAVNGEALRLEVMNMAEEEGDVEWAANNALEDFYDQINDLKMEAALLSGDASRLMEDMDSNGIDWDVFDDLFVAEGEGALTCYNDTGIDFVSCNGNCANAYDDFNVDDEFEVRDVRQAAQKRLERMTKQELLLQVRQGLSVFTKYTQLQTRHAILMAAADSISANTRAETEAADNLIAAYDAYCEGDKDAAKRIDRAVSEMPQEIWVA